MLPLDGVKVKLDKLNKKTLKKEVPEAGFDPTEWVLLCLFLFSLFLLSRSFHHQIH